MSVDDLEKYEAEIELALFREYRDVLPMFRYVVETQRRLYLANGVDVQPRRIADEDAYLEITLTDCWVWDMYRASRFVPQVRVVTFHDVCIEDRAKPDDAGELAPPAATADLA